MEIGPNQKRISDQDQQLLNAVQYSRELVLLEPHKWQMNTKTAKREKDFVS